MMQTKTQRGGGAQSDAEQRRKRAVAASAALWNPATDSGTEMEVKSWSWPIDLSRYDRRSALTRSETAFLAKYANAYALNQHAQTPAYDGRIDRLVKPIEDVFEYIRLRTACRPWAITYILRETASRGRSIWGWSRDEWIDTINRRGNDRQSILSVAYLLCDFSDVHRLGGDRIIYIVFARKLFGTSYIVNLLRRARECLTEWGYLYRATRNHACRLLCQALIQNRSPRLHDLTMEFLDEVAATTTDDCRRSVVALACVLNRLIGFELPRDVRKRATLATVRPPTTEEVPAEWALLCDRWFKTSTDSLSPRRHKYYVLLKIGRWLGREHPDMVAPQQWTREFASSVVAIIFQLRCGDWTDALPQRVQNFGKPLAPSTRVNYLTALRTFFRDLQEWEIIPRRFDPIRTFATPNSLRALVGIQPRIIADDIWAKLVWAGLNLKEDDLPRRPTESRPTQYRIEMVRAFVITWLFAALRMNEILRLRVGCIRWQREDAAIPETGDSLAANAVCFIDIPVNKTSTEYTKPVDRVVGEAITGWEQVRPTQEKRLDPKTGELVHFLFSCGHIPVGRSYLNKRLIPILCKKAGIPACDVRGRITSHRARSTIASQLFNAKEPMGLFELQQFLGHASPASTQRYLRITPTKLAKSYSDAGYFARNIRAVEVLIDQGTVRSGTVATEPWKYYDLGHGYCTYDFFDQCPYRMACAKCDFYLPKESSRAQMLEAKDNLLKLRQEIPLTDDELVAVQDGVAAYENLLTKLIDLPTPAGPSLRKINGNGLVQIANAAGTKSSRGRVRSKAMS
jgi:integrase